MNPLAQNHYHLRHRIADLIEDGRLDCLVFGLGPTAHLLPYVDQSRLRHQEMVTAHDGGSIIPTSTLLLLDPPERSLAPWTSRFEAIHRCRPGRILVLRALLDTWASALHPSVRSIMEPLDLHIHSPEPAHPDETILGGPEYVSAVTFPLQAPKPHTALISPVAGVTTAWARGRRRIGVLGVDMLPGQHHTSHPFYVSTVDKIMCVLAEQAEAAGGCIVNLSPITSLKSFATRTSAARALGVEERDLRLA